MSWIYALNALTLGALLVFLFYTKEETRFQRWNGSFLGFGFLKRLGMSESRVEETGRFFRKAVILWLILVVMVILRNVLFPRGGS